MKKTLKKIIPTNIRDYLSKLRYKPTYSRYYNKEHKEVFTTIYNEAHWGNEASLSGAGSSLKQTEGLIPQLQHLFKEYNIQSILDLPCGDFHWMQAANISGIDYVGADIVEELILANKEKYESDNIRFVQLDLRNDKLPKTDLVIHRDCFVHFSYDDIQKSITNLKSSGCQYFLSTSFPGLKVNHDITTGDWRPINLQRKPFHFPAPIHVLNEWHEPGFEKEYKGKMLGLWKIEDL